MTDTVPEQGAPDPRPTSPWDYHGPVRAQQLRPADRTPRSARLLWAGPAAAALVAIVAVFLPWGTDVYHTGGTNFTVTGTLVTQSEFGQPYIGLGIVMLLPLMVALLAVLVLAIAAVCGTQRFDRVVTAAAAGAVLCELGAYMYMRGIPRTAIAHAPSLRLSLGAWLGFAGAIVALVLAVVALRADRAERAAVAANRPGSAVPTFAADSGSVFGRPGVVSRRAADAILRAFGAALALAAGAMVFLGWVVVPGSGGLPSAALNGLVFNQFAAVPALACLLASALYALPRFSRVSAWRWWRFGAGCAALGCLAVLLLSIVVSNAADAAEGENGAPLGFAPATYLALIFAFTATVVSRPVPQQSATPQWAVQALLGVAPPVDPGPDRTTQSW